MGEGRASTHTHGKLNAVLASFAFLLIFAGAISLMVVVNFKKDTPAPMVSWWQRSIIYHVYMPSFKDSNGDGYGDLKGITDKLDHIKEIGANSVWLSPFFSCGGIETTDMGYDVIDHQEVDELFGDMKDFEALKEKASELDLYLIIDFIPNHMSDQSEQFIKSSNTSGTFSDWFIWRNGSNFGDQDYLTNHQPPNNWTSQTREPAWEWNDVRKQYYLHNGLPSMPDLNLKNADVRKHLKQTLEFWLAKGVHGFRLGALNLLIEDESEPNLIHSDIEATIELMEEWTNVLKEHEDKAGDHLHRLLMVELVHDPDRVVDGDNHYQNFTYDVVDNPFGFHTLFGDDMSPPTGISVAKAVKEYIDSIPEDSWPNWVIHTHDMKGRETIPEKMRETLMIMSMTLPGTCINYYGDEIGMSRKQDISFEETQDTYAKEPYANVTTYQDISRDPSRTPMQWTAAHMAGFTNGTESWLPINPESGKNNVESQKNLKLNDTITQYHIFTKLALLRDEVALYSGDIFFPYQDENAFCFIRKSSTEQVAYLVAINFNTNADHSIVKIDFTSLFPEFPTSGEVIISDSSHSASDAHVPGEEILLEDFELFALEAIVIKIDFSDQDSLDEE